MTPNGPPEERAAPPAKGPRLPHLAVTTAGVFNPTFRQLDPEPEPEPAAA